MSEICSKCQTHLDDDAIFCPECATPVNPCCPKCEKPIARDAKFCKYCAYDFSQSQASTAEKITTRNEQRSFVRQPFASGIDTLLVDKYHAMSDSELLATLRGNLSEHTEKTLSIVLRELESRKNLDWRDVEAARSRVREAINSVNLYGSRRSYSERSSANSAREKADRLIKSGGVTAGVSALLFLWGYGYTSNLANSARAGLMNLAGQTDSTYQLAKLCVGLGAIGFIVGLVLLIVGISQRSS